ncbi:uncharacterized protein H6S33_008899 [Morchella sextelata]|uniref:uncharacterized protein n=1 Tax=Morchella sextelata TaxID=1174677 RepID=UPI001D03BF3C|nr:uncharacterized protein H6S33_008899 [Morchella sextelata]KAH0612519.1 hypothetical protein H6S33_008899 [Morchella sextelata]
MIKYRLHEVRKDRGEQKKVHAVTSSIEGGGVAPLMDYHSRSVTRAPRGPDTSCKHLVSLDINKSPLCFTLANRNASVDGLLTVLGAGDWLLGFIGTSYSTFVLWELNLSIQNNPCRRKSSNSPVLRT